VAACTALGQQLAWWVPAAGGGEGGWVPTDITGCVIWLDGADTAVLNLDGTAVTKWDDKSGNAQNSETQATSTKRPAYQPGTGIFFDGGDTLQFLGFPSLAQPCTYVFVTRCDSYVGWSSPWYKASSPYNGSFEKYSTTGLYRWTFGVNVNGVDPWSATTAVTIWKAEGVSSTLDENGSSLFIGNPSAAASSAGTFWLGSETGAAYFWRGLINEFIVYNHALSAGDQSDLESYILTKWSISP